MPQVSRFSLDPTPKAITFDCYGTLVQWHECFEFPGLAGIDKKSFLFHRLTTFRGEHLDDAEMALSRTLEPDPGHAGVGTEIGVPRRFFSSPLHLDLRD